MSKTASPTSTRIMQADGDQCVELRGIDWNGYSTVLNVRGERSIPRMIYLDGSLYLMSPSYRHENLKERLGVLVTEVVTGLSIRLRSRRADDFSATSQARRSRGDHSYYLANADRVRGKKRIILSTDPPPDLVIEAVATHEADDALGSLPEASRSRGLGLHSDRADNSGTPAERSLRRIRAKRGIARLVGTRDLSVGVCSSWGRDRHRMDVRGPPLGCRGCLRHGIAKVRSRNGR